MLEKKDGPWFKCELQQILIRVNNASIIWSSHSTCFIVRVFFVYEPDKSKRTIFKFFVKDHLVDIFDVNTIPTSFRIFSTTLSLS